MGFSSGLREKTTQVQVHGDTGNAGNTGNTWNTWAGVCED